jgi:hypothetical protein
VREKEERHRGREVQRRTEREGRTSGEETRAESKDSFRRSTVWISISSRFPSLGRGLEKMEIERTAGEGGRERERERERELT